MAAVRGKDTAPEMSVRSMLHRLGFRFRLHDQALPGAPDIVLPRHGAVVFVHGCFWHQHGCGRGTKPATRADYWGPKLRRNCDRDKSNCRQLRRLGWRVLVVWECEINRPDALRARLARFFGVEARRAAKTSGGLS